MTVSKSKIYSSIKWNSVNIFFIAILTIVQMYILFRLLSKEDFGIMATISAAYFYLRAICTFQIGEAIMHTDNIRQNRKKLSSAIWGLLILSTIVYVLVILFGSFYADIFSNNSIYFGLSKISLLLFFDVIYEVYRSILHKELQFDKLFTISFLGKSVYFFSSILLAYLGFGYKALLYSFFLSAITESVLAYFYGRKMFTPILYFKWSLIRDVMRFGGYSSGSRFLRKIRDQFDTILIGRFFGMETLGVYNVFKSLLLRLVKILSPLVGNVTTPLLTREKSNFNHAKNIFYTQNKFYTLFTFPLFMGLLVFSKSVIGYYFGQEYLPNIFLFQLLTIAYLLSNTTALMNTLVVSHGEVKGSFYWNGLSLGCYVLVVYALFSKGVEAIAIGLIVFFVIKILFAFNFVIKQSIGGKASDFFMSFSMELFFALGTGIIFYLILFFFNPNILFEVILMILYSIVVGSYFLYTNRQIIKEIVSKKEPLDLEFPK